MTWPIALVGQLVDYTIPVRKTACKVGTLKPGQSTTVHVTMRVLVPGNSDNVAAAGSATPDLHLISNKAVARVRVTRRRHHFVACPARAHAASGPPAHIAC